MKYERISPYNKNVINFNTEVGKYNLAIKASGMKRGSEVAREISKTCFTMKDLVKYYNELSPMYQATEQVIKALKDHKRYLQTGEKCFGGVWIDRKGNIVSE